MMRSLVIGVLGALALAGAAAAQDTLAPTEAPSSRSTSATTPPIPSVAHALTKDDVDVWLDGYMRYALESADIPGAVVTVVKDGQLLTARGYGYADVAHHTPVNPDRTLFRPGSVSKLVTWTAVMQQVEQGKLDLDTDVNRYLDFKIPPRNGQPITLREIMTHTSGFEEHAKDVIFYDPSHLRPLGNYVKNALPKRVYDAGTTPAYSNYATALAGYIVERSSGEPFADYVEKHIFQPLGMTNSTFRQPLPQQFRSQMARGYPKPGQPQPFELVGPAPAGSLSSTGVDMARFMIAHLQGGTLGSNRILKAETSAMMHQSPLDRVNPYSLIPPLNRMELGFFETNVNGHEVIGHLGDTQAFHTSLHLFLNDGVGLFVSFNSPGRQGAVGPLRTALFQDFSDRYFPSIVKDGQVDARTARKHAQMMTGLWQESRRSHSSILAAIGLFNQTEVKIGPSGTLLVPALKAVAGRPREWVEIAPFVWRQRDGHDRLAAKVVGGKVVRWSVDGESPFIVFDRVPGSQSAAWLKPSLYASMLVLALTFLFWPIGWFVRRRYQASMSLTGRDLTIYRATRLGAGLTLAVLIAWVVVITTAFSNLKNLAGALDPVMMLLQIAGAIIFVATVAIAAWNFWLVLRAKRKWTSIGWNALVLAAALVVLYFAVEFNLLAMSTSY
jgi:CubicO group peptidase (beta-lactamase class C family)